MNDRHLKSTCFEPMPSGFAFYANAWSKGVAVSADERELYLSGAYSDWLNAIYGRSATLPARKWLHSAKRMLLAVWRGFDSQSPD